MIIIIGQAMEFLPAALCLLTLFCDVTSSANCTGLADGTYMIDCTNYFVCKNGVAAGHACPTPPAEHIIFNNVTGKCDKPANVALPCGGLHYDCSNKADRDYADLASNCTTFAVCYGGKLEGYQHCPADLVFHEDIQTCDWIGRVPPPCGTKV